MRNPTDALSRPDLEINLEHHRVFKHGTEAVSYTHLAGLAASGAGGLLRPRREEPLPQAQKRGRRPLVPRSGSLPGAAAVSYTHLDVYKRQPLSEGRLFIYIL